MTAPLAAEGSDFFVPDAGSPAYDGYALVAGKDVRVAEGAQVTGAVRSNEDVDLSLGGAIAGDVAAVGVVSWQAGITGAVTEGQAALLLPVLPTPAEAQAMAGTVHQEDLNVQEDVVLSGITYVFGDAVFHGAVNGVGTVIATGDIRLEWAPGAVLDPEARVSLIALREIWLDDGRPLRGLLLV